MRIKARVTPLEFEELIRPKLKLFLSVDVVGSTEFKQRGKSASTQSWLSFFLGFYLTFSNLLSEHLAEQSPAGRNLDVRLWKSLGDELIFTAELARRTDAAAYLKAFRLALLAALRNWELEETDHGLLLKATAWIAGFPVGNAEIPLEAGNAEKADGCDYIGPQLDTGFRLKAHSTPRKMVLSADLAYLLVSVSEENGLRLFFEDDIPLKGVLHGKPYPIIWVDCDEAEDGGETLYSLKDKLRGRNQAESAQLKAYLRCWFARGKGALMTPFIAADPFDDLCPPTEYETHREASRRELYQMLFVSDPGEQGTEESPPIPSPLADFLKQE